MYFDKPGKVNTQQTLELACQRGRSLGLNEVVLASSPGETAHQASKFSRDSRSSAKREPSDGGMTVGCLERHIVLVAPEIHWNTGNIGRTCLAVGAQLHLIKPLGFSLQSRELKRAGLDYWPRVRLSVWDDLESCLAELAPQPQDVAVFSKNGLKPLWAIPKTSRLALVFGSETRGLPQAFLSRYHKQSYHIPISADIRSLNLSTAVGIALYESLRGLSPVHAWPASRRTRDESVPL